MPVRPEEGALKGAVSGVHDSREAALDALLQRAGRLQKWITQDVDPELKEQLAEDRRRLADELLEGLVLWAELGGKVRLGDVELGGPPASLAESIRTPVRVESGPETVVVRRTIREGATIVSRPPVATGDSIRGLARHFETGAAVRPEGVATNWEELLGRVVEVLGTPRDDADAEVLVLYNVIREADRWRALPREVQRTLVGLVTARLRRAQDEMGISGPRLDDSFSMLSAWSKREQPGWVNGLSRGHLPTRGSWTADADAYTARLPGGGEAPTVRENAEKLLGAISAFAPEFESAPAEAMDAVATQFKGLVRKALDGGVRNTDPRLLRLCSGHAELFDTQDFRGLRRALREDAEPSEGEDDDKAPPLPPDWAWWGRTRFRRGVLVGGDPREPNRVRLEQSFGFQELDWVGTEGKGKHLQTVRDRLRSGKVDIVIILGGFVGHDADEIILPAARECGVDWVHVDKGYGIARIRRAIERFLDPLAARG